MELYLVLSVVDRSRAEELLSLHRELGLSLSLTNMGRGTATSDHLLLHELKPEEKALVSTIAAAEAARQLIKMAKRKLYFDIPGNGVMMTIPLKSVGGGKTLAYLTDGQTTGGAQPAMNFENELIVVILNEGYCDQVMDTARQAGATGGTVLHAKGTGRARTEKFFNVSLAEEKDMIYILAGSKKKAAIMQAIHRHCGPETKVGAICFSLPVSEVVGVRRLEDED